MHIIVILLCAFILLYKANGQDYCKKNDVLALMVSGFIFKHKIRVLKTDIKTFFDDLDCRLCIFLRREPLGDLSLYGASLFKLYTIKRESVRKNDFLLEHLGQLFSDIIQWLGNFVKFSNALSDWSLDGCPIGVRDFESRSVRFIFLTLKTLIEITFFVRRLPVRLSHL